MEATGDLEGTGIWNFEQDGTHVNITYDWTIRANKPVVQKLSFLLKPIFRSNHHWTMRRGEASLKLELLRRRARSCEEAARIPAPPGPAFPHNLWRPETFLESRRPDKTRQSHSALRRSATGSPMAAFRRWFRRNRL